MALQTYRITRTGPKHFRYEHADRSGEPTGEPWSGSLMRKNATGGIEPAGRYVLVGYGVGPGLRPEIRLDAVGAKTLAHMGLVPVLGGGSRVKVIGGSAIVDAGADASGDAGGAGEPDASVKVPDEWRSLSESKQRGLAAKIAGLDKADVTPEQAVSIIEAHVAAGGTHSG
jgi:hypothetical protein